MYLTAGATQTPKIRAGISLLEKVFVILALLFIFRTIRGVIGGEHVLAEDRTSGTLLFQVIALGFYGTGLLALAWRSPAWLPRLLIQSWPLFLLVALTLVSALWSDYPMVTARRSLALILTMGFAIYVVARFSTEDFLDVLAIAMICYLLIGFAAAAVPEVGFHQIKHVGSFRGLTGHKNELGRVVALMAVLAIVMRHHGRIMPRAYIPVSIAALIALVMTGSATALVAAIATLLLTPLVTLTLTGRRGRYYFSGSLRAVLVTIVLVLVVPMIVLGLPHILELVGRDLTLSGRTKLWGYAVELGMQRPWFGAGYRSFWTDANTIYFAEFFSWGGSKGPDQGHSGYLDLWLEMGVAGVLLYLVFLSSVFLSVARLFKSGRGAEGLLLSTVFVFLTIYSITEKIMLLQSEIVWFLSMLAYFYAQRARVLNSPVIARNSWAEGFGRRPGRRAPQTGLAERGN